MASASSGWPRQSISTMAAIFTIPAIRMNSSTRSGIGRLAGLAKFDKYRVSLGYTARNAELFDGKDFNDYQVQLSVGTDLPDGWAIDVGYKFFREQDENSHIIGAKLAKKIEFDTGTLEKPKSD